MGRSVSGTDACLPDWECIYIDNTPEHQAKVRPYYLDRYEVTVGRFRAFMAAYDAWRQAGHPSVGEGAIEGVPGSGWQSEWSVSLADSRASESAAITDIAVLYSDQDLTWTDSPGEAEAYPVYAVDWYMAQAFCIWDGGRLPTEAEWEFAAAGGEENRLFPWGQALPVSTGSNANAVFGCSGTDVCTNRQKDLAPVGSRSLGDGRYGHADLLGSVSEWIWDRYTGDWYTTVGDPCTDCVQLQTADPSDYVVIRGTDFQTSATIIDEYFANTSRKLSTRTNRIKGLGLRCARNQ
jgi:formylglycine-generating enzyme required for sulfatase activity